MIINEDFFDDNETIISHDEIDDIEQDKKIPYRFTLLFNNSLNSNDDYYMKYMNYIFSNLSCVKNYLVENHTSNETRQITVHYNLVNNLNPKNLYEYAKLLTKYEMSVENSKYPHTFSIRDNERELDCILTHTTTPNSYNNVEDYIIAAIFTIHGYQDHFISYIKDSDKLYNDFTADLESLKNTTVIKKLLVNKDFSYENVEFFQLLETNGSRDVIYSAPAEHNIRSGILVANYGELYKSIKEYLKNGGKTHYIETKARTKDCILIRYWLHCPFFMNIWVRPNNKGLIMPGIVCVDVIKDRNEWKKETAIVN